MASLNTSILCASATLLACLCATPPAAVAQDADVIPEPAISDTRMLLNRWVEVRRTISKQKSDWVLGKQILEDRIDLLQRSIESVEEQIAAQKEKLDGFDESVASLQAKNEKLKQAADELAQLVDEMELRTVALLEGAPQPLIEGVKPLAVQLPGYGKQGEEQPDAEAAASESEGQENEAKEQKPGPPLARRVENVVGALYLFNKFAGKIDQTSELVSRPDGTALSVDAIYLGTSYGFYIDDENKVAAAGWSAPKGWTWQGADASAGRVRQAIQVINKDQPAAFVGLPVEVK